LRWQWGQFLGAKRGLQTPPPPRSIFFWDTSRGFLGGFGFGGGGSLCCDVLLGVGFCAGHVPKGGGLGM